MNPLPADTQTLRRRPILGTLFESLAREVALTVLGARRGERVLEVGVGAGEDFLKLATLVGPTGHAAGIDGAERALALTEARLREVQYGNFELCRASPVRLPFDSASFDAVYCGFGLQTLPDAEVPQALAEVKRVLRPGGRATVCGHTPGEKLLARALARSWSALHRAAPALVGNSRPRTLAEQARAAGLEVDRRLYLEQRGVPSEVLLLLRPIAAI